MAKHWEQVGPPVYVSVAAYLGLGEKVDPKKPKKLKVGKGDDPADLMRQFSHTGGMIN